MFHVRSLSDGVMLLQLQMVASVRWPLFWDGGISSFLSSGASSPVKQSELGKARGISGLGQSHEVKRVQVEPEQRVQTPQRCCEPFVWAVTLSFDGMAGTWQDSVEPNKLSPPTLECNYTPSWGFYIALRGTHLWTEAGFRFYNWVSDLDDESGQDCNTQSSLSDISSGVS